MASLRKVTAAVLAGVVWTGAATVLWGSGCAATPEPAAPEPCDVQIVTLTIFSADNINPNENGNPRPVVVQLYQLRNDVRLLNASYDDVLLHGKETLGDDVAKKDEIEIFPNDLVEVKFEMRTNPVSGVSM